MPTAVLILLIFLSGLGALASEPSSIIDKTAHGVPNKLAIPALSASKTYNFAFSFLTLSELRENARVTLRLSQGELALVEKELHGGDADLFVTVKPARDGAALLTVETEEEPAQLQDLRFSVRIHEVPESARVEREPNDKWEEANQIALGSTIFASADDVPYIPFESAETKLFQQGVDWYRFDFQSSVPKLVYFALDLMERDNIPVDVSIYRAADGKPEIYREGEDPVTLPHEVQALPGNKFTTRVLREPGAYYIRVAANHPAYKLRTRVYDPPPYQDPKEAVRTAVDYIVGAGDSWHANTPRRGGVYDRVSNVHQETSLCVACHATHFPQRAAVYAARNGYPVALRQQVQFMAERFYNNPRPFYGFEQDGAVWARVISAPANVLGRMSHLIDLYEQELSGERRESYHDGIREYLDLYYKDRETLPADETNGNTPIVSTYEVAWYAWETTKDPTIARLIGQDQIKNMLDLCYQTLALASIDRKEHAAKIAANAERILSLQRPSGQWAMKFEADQPEVEFQTGHALWALHAAGIPADHPQVKKAIAYLLKRQQPFGGWMDPEQSYENFKTPFRETQMAVLALSSYFPLAGRQKGWNADGDGGSVLDSLDQTWGPQSGSAMSDLQRKSKSPDVLVRQQAIEALGRVASPGSLPLLMDHLGDPSKLVQRTAAWAVRQVYSRHPEASIAPLDSALASRSDRVRWGATRVFATHFAALAKHPSLAGALSALAEDPLPAVRMQAIKGLWQFWFWTSDDATKDRIEDVILSGLSKDQHPWVARNLREALYNVADENIRYLYNNWIPLLADAKDRDRAIRGRLEVESRLARKIAGILETGADSHKKAVLTGLTEYHLRRSDVYDPKVESSGPPPPVYNRIGNDIEQIVFFGESSSAYSEALYPLLTSDDPDMKRLALKGSLLARDTKYPTVVEIAGEPGPGRDQLLTAVLNIENIAPELRKGLTPPEGQKAATRAPAAAPPSQAESSAASGKPDESYFKMYVRPIFEAKGRDGYACVQCHSSHTLFNGSYATALNVIDTANPENSLLLKKPTSSAETEGTLRSRTTAHGGGVRWEAGSKEYNTILKWIRGAKP